MRVTIGASAVRPANAAAATASGRRLALAVAIAAGVAFGALGGDGASVPDLLVLMRFMAGVKAAMALAAAALLWWRMGAPMPRGAAVAYTAAAAVMAAGPGLIWNMDHIALGAAAVHGGLLALLVTAWLDRAGWNGVLNAELARRRRMR